jgi:uncharacterized protein (DUF1810 family)
MSDLHNLQRFIDAQAPIYKRVVAELSAGKKTSHWMWFVFPQLDGLGRSSMAQRFAITSREQVKAYWQLPVLSSRLQECIELLTAVNGKSAFQILGTPDDLKFRSCLTLFAAVLPDEPVFKLTLDKYFAGNADAKTIELLRAL